MPEYDPILKSNERNMHRHPCFNNYDFHSAIIHLPIATTSNLVYKRNLLNKLEGQNFCKKDSNVLLSLKDALAGLRDAKKSLPNLSVVAIAGPNEPLADFETLKYVLSYVRQKYPKLLLCVATNGLLLPIYVRHLISLGLNSVSITLNTLDPMVGAKIYEQISYMGNTYFGLKAAKILLENQMIGIQYLVNYKIAVKLNIEIIPGVNEDEIEDIIQFAKKSGCTLTNVLRMDRVKNESGLETYYSDGYGKKRAEYEKIMTQSYFCRACHMASIETLNTILTSDFTNSNHYKREDAPEDALRLRFAVCSKNGTLTDEHFGRAAVLYIYEYAEGKIYFLEKRTFPMYAKIVKEGKKKDRIYPLIHAIKDCNCLICMKIGSCPSEALKEQNIDTYMTYNLIEAAVEEAVKRLYEGRRLF